MVFSVWRRKSDFCYKVNEGNNRHSNSISLSHFHIRAKQKQRGMGPLAGKMCVHISLTTLEEFFNL